jgi:hypothetical protein
MEQGNKTPERMQRASDALKYEIDMFRSLAAYFTSGTVSPIVVANALVESFLVHVRVLTDFLYPERKYKKGNRKEHDDIMAKDFFDSCNKWGEIRPPKSSVLEEACTRANKLSAHLTYTRLENRVNQQSPVQQQIAEELEKVLSIFVENVPKEFLGRRWKTRS